MKYKNKKTKSDILSDIIYENEILEDDEEWCDWKEDDWYYLYGSDYYIDVDYDLIPGTNRVNMNSFYPKEVIRDRKINQLFDEDDK